MKPTLLIIFLFTAIHASGLGICNDIFASAGNFESGANGSIAWTLGEPVSEAEPSRTMRFSLIFSLPFTVSIAEPLLNQRTGFFILSNSKNQKS